MLIFIESRNGFSLRPILFAKGTTVLWLSAIMLSCVGCSILEPESVEIANVKGQVLLDDQPLPGAKVLFIPQNKNLGNRFATSQAITDAEGNFELRLSDDRVGAYVGRHYVLISKAEEPADGNVAELNRLLESADSKPVSIPPEIGNDQKDVVPRYYNVETELTFVVVAGEINNAKFELTAVDPLLKK